MSTNVRFALRSWFAPAAAVAIGGLCAGAAGQTCPPWEVVDTPDPAGAQTAILRDIVAISPTEVWAVGDYWSGTRIIQFSMRWDGAEWSFHDIPLRSTLGHGHLWAVDARGGELWAAGDQQHADSQGFWGTHPLALRWDGSQWEHVDVPPSASAVRASASWTCRFWRRTTSGSSARASPRRGPSRRSPCAGTARASSTSPRRG